MHTAGFTNVLTVPDVCVCVYIFIYINVRKKQIYVFVIPCVYFKAFALI